LEVAESDMISCVKQSAKEMCALNNLSRCFGAYREKSPSGLSVLSFLTSAAILLLTFSCLAPTGYALEITNQKSDRHVEAADTGAFFVPAPGLASTDSLNGFESKERNIQVIAANFGAPLDEIAKGFTEESFKAMGMELKSRGEFTVNGARAFLYKVLHPRADANWGKWIMLAENGGGTLEVNAIFVSGDAEAAGDLEAMLKGVYMEPLPQVAANAASPAGEIAGRPVSGDIPGHSASGNARAAATPVQPAGESRDIPSPAGGVSPDVRSESEAKPASLDTDSSKPDGDVSADLAKPALAGKNVSGDGEAASNDVTVTVGSDAVSSDTPARKAKVRIITENGIVTVEDGPTGAADGENGSAE
jgi:hypothetical protein